MKKAKIGDPVVVHGYKDMYFKSYIGKIGTIVKFCNSRDAILLRFNDGKEIVFDAKHLSLADEIWKREPGRGK